MENESSNKKSSRRHRESCATNATEVKEAILLNALEDEDDDYKMDREFSKDIKDKIKKKGK